MDTATHTEAELIKTSTLLVVLSKLEDQDLVKDLCGTRVIIDDLFPDLPSFSKKIVYLCGDISKANDLNLKTAEQVFVIRELSHSYGTNHSDALWTVVHLGQVPIFVHGVGVYYRRFFDPTRDCFKQVSKEHAFQSLTESSKPGTAHRSGIYLTPVEHNGEELHFRLLRCSTNLSGPTENFLATDAYIVNALNQEAARLFQSPAPLNHVLAQIYNNTPATDTQKQTKAKISSHADKTKDMPENGIMAFCTFYDELEKLEPLANDRFDYGYRETSGLTKLVFKLKKSERENSEGTLPTQFTITMYPNSVFFMPLSTNRLYTHEIRSSMLDAKMLPTRMGYVVRCSTTEAVHKCGNTFLKRENLILLEPPTSEGMASLRKLYAAQNKTTGSIDYGDEFLFSMNQGDYTAPKYEMADEFRLYSLPTKDNVFEELLASVRFEDVAKGRQGTVLVKPHETRGTPIVRTTTKYSIAAQCFKSVHTRLAQQIKTSASLQAEFNNALIENYRNAYASMGAHSDQELDLDDESYIALFSCYKHPVLASPPRKLVVTPKEGGGDTFEIGLAQNSVVVFSLRTNQRFKHKIVLDASGSEAENQWLGITYRTSKTFVKSRNAQTFFEDGTLLTLANDDQSREFYRLRGRENRLTDFTYPPMPFTISESDMVPPSP